MEPSRRLWCAVVQQALDDLQSEVFDSLWHNQAVAFMIGGGTWREGRSNIADLLGIQPDTLHAWGRRMVNADRASRGLPPLKPERTKPVEPPPPLPMLVAVPGPAPAAPKPRRTWPLRSWRERYEFNPFDPWRTLPSDERKAG